MTADRSPHDPPSRRPLLMIPGPIEISPAVRAAAAGPPPSHTAPDLIEAFGTCLERLREVWGADESAQPFILAGGGTAAMDMAVTNLVGPGDAALVVDTGYFSDRIAEMLRRTGAEVHEVQAAVGDAPTPEEVAQALEDIGPVKVLAATHVDTSTGVRVDPEPLARLARETGALSVFDGVCATAGERFEMAAWDADVYLTASQKAIGLPAGLGLLVASERALAARRTKPTPPPMALDWEQWLPIHRAYEERRPSYFSTPATTLILALEVGLEEILANGGREGRWEAHRRAARAMRAGWRALGLEPVPLRDELLANTLSALWLPDGVEPSLVGRIGEYGVTVAGGLHPDIKSRYFRVGHMGYAVTRPEMLLRTVGAVGGALADAGTGAEPEAAVAAAREVLVQVEQKVPERSENPTPAEGSG